MEAEDVRDARLREAHGRDGRRVELTRADLLHHQVLVAGLRVPLEVELELAVRVVRHFLAELLELLAPGRVLRSNRADLEGGDGASHVGHARHHCNRREHQQRFANHL